MSVFRAFIVFLLLFIGANLFVESSFFKENVYKNSKIGFFYLAYDWSQKKSKVLVNSYDEGTAFFGSSPTVYSINPSELERLGVGPVFNFGLLGASQKEILKILKIHQKEGARFDQIVIEFNPLSISNRHILINSSADFAKSLVYQELEHKVPMYSWLSLNIPLVKYAGVIKQVFIDNLFKRKVTTNELNRRKIQVHHHEFLSLIKNDRGHISNDFPLNQEANSELKEFLVDQCKVMAQWNFQDDIPFETEESSLLLKETIEIAKAMADKVIFWIPPFHSSWHEIVKAKYYKNSLDTISSYGLNVFDLRGVNILSDDNLFVDCAHQNKTGSELLNNYFATTIFKSGSK